MGFKGFLSNEGSQVQVSKNVFRKKIDIAHTEPFRIGDFPSSFASALAGALAEMTDNVVQHSETEQFISPFLTVLF